MYPAELVQPMRDELTTVGFDQLADAPAVNAALAKEGTTLVVVNSVCGCAAANAVQVCECHLPMKKTRSTYNRFCGG